MLLFLLLGLKAKLFECFLNFLQLLKLIVLLWSFVLVLFLLFLFWLFLGLLLLFLLLLLDYFCFFFLLLIAIVCTEHREGIGNFCLLHGLHVFLLLFDLFLELYLAFLLEKLLGFA
jgi:hypothetical protein